MFFLLNATIQNDTIRYLQNLNENIDAVRRIVDVSNTTIANEISAVNTMQRLANLVEESKRHELTGFIGGPPCPDFSVAGRNKGKDGDNGKLSQTYADLICNIHPDFFLFENVKGLYRTARHREFFEHLKQQFRNNGYSLTERLINSLEYGAPQD